MTTILKTFSQEKKTNHLKHILRICTKQERKTLMAFFRFCGDEIAPNKLNDFMLYLLERSNLKNSTISVYLYRLKSLFKRVLEKNRDFSIAKKLEIEHFINSVKPPKKNTLSPTNKVLTAEQVNALLSVLPKKISLICKFLSVTGCRVSEALSIKDKDIQKSQDFAFIEVLGKGNKYRKVFIPNGFLNELLKEFKSDGYLFVKKNGKRYDRKNINEFLTKYTKKHNLPKVSPHCFRHTFATEKIASQKLDISAVSRYLGHSSVSITLDLYVNSRLNPSDLFKKEREVQSVG